VSKFKSAAICLTLACALAIPVTAGTIIVSNTNDSGPGSLRQALVDANDCDTIDATGISGVITLTTGELAVDKSVTINAGGADVLAVDGNATSRLFQIGTGETVAISGLTIRNGRDDTTGGGINNESGATLTITNSTLSGNTAGSVNNPAVEGGGIFNSGTLTIVSSTVSANTAGGTSGSGGGIENLGTLTILNSTFSGNTAIKGGGIHNSGPATAVTITNSTLSGNSASAYGGACFNGGTMHIANSTLSGNSAFIGGGILVFGPLEIGTTILSRGDSGANIDSFGEVTVTSTGYNLSSDDGSGHLTALATRSTQIRCLVHCKTTAVRPSRIRCYPVARLLTQATRASLRRLGTTSAAVTLLEWSTVGSTSAHLKCNADTDSKVTLTRTPTPPPRPTPYPRPTS